MGNLAIVPGPEGEFVELTRTKQGKVFKKHILSVGELLYPKARGGKVTVDEAFLQHMKENYEKNYVPHVQVPLAGANNEHTEDPLRNIGEVVDLSIEGGKMYAHIDVRKHSEDVGKTILGASAMFSLDYTDTKTQQNVGPTLVHVAATNRPYVTDLDDFEEIVALSDDSVNDEAVLLTASNSNEPEETVNMTLQEILDLLKAEHDIDVAALQASLAEKDTELETVQTAATTETEAAIAAKDAELEASKAEVERVLAEAEEAKNTAAELETASVALSNALRDKLVDQNLVQLSNTDEVLSADQIISGVNSLVENNVKLSNEVTDLVKADEEKTAKHRIEGYIASGHILEKDKDAQLELLLSAPDLFEKLVPEQPVIRLSNENGFEKIAGQQDLDVKAELDRITGEAEKLGYSVNPHN